MARRRAAARKDRAEHAGIEPGRARARDRRNIVCSSRNQAKRTATLVRHQPLGPMHAIRAARNGQFGVGANQQIKPARPAAETETPFVLWGAGVRKARPSKGEMCPREWELDHVLRQDVEQADVAPLVAALLGSAFPSNSALVLPTLSRITLAVFDHIVINVISPSILPLCFSNSSSFKGNN